MYYIKLNITLSLNQKWEEENFWIADVFKDSLIAIGFDSFVDTQNGFEAYESRPFGEFYRGRKRKIMLS